MEIRASASPWLGHDPSPEVEFLDDGLRVWQDGGPNRRQGRCAGVYVDVPRSVLSALLMGVQQDLVSFIRVLHGWAQRIGSGHRRDALVKTIDRSFAVSAALDLTIESH